MSHPNKRQFGRRMKVNCPTIFPFLQQRYPTSTLSLLLYEEFILLSQNGDQQGSQCCSPLIFSAAIQCVVDALVSEFVMLYLDDFTIAWEHDTVLQDFRTVKAECAEIGLQVNPTECELFCSEMDQSTIIRFNETSSGICIVDELTLLEPTITDTVFDIIFQKKLNGIFQLETTIVVVLF